MWNLHQNGYNAPSEWLSQYTLVPVFNYILTITKLKRSKQTFLECNYGISNMASKCETDSSKFFQTVFYVLQWPSLEPPEVKLWNLKSVKNRINCTDKIAFGVDVGVSIDVDGCIESKSVRCMLQILFMWSVKRQITLFPGNSLFEVSVGVFQFAN